MEEIPVGVFLVNGSGMLPFVITVVPLREVWFNFRRRAWNYQFARSSRALSWTGQNVGIRDGPQSPAKFPRLILAACDGVLRSPEVELVVGINGRFDRPFNEPLVDLRRPGGSRDALAYLKSSMQAAASGTDQSRWLMKA